MPAAWAISSAPRSRSGLGIVAALAAESRPLGRLRRGGEPLALLADGTLLIVSGMGWSAAAAGARALIEAGAQALISWGMAGALDPALGAGTVVLPEEVTSREGARFLTARDWREQLRRALPARYPVCGGRLLSCREPIGSAADKASAFRETGARAVDMESLAVAEIAASDRLPFIAVRAIVDTARDELPRGVLAAVAGAEVVRIGRLLGSLARAPAEVPALIRLARRYRAARAALASVARSGALAPPAASVAAGTGRA